MLSPLACTIHAMAGSPVISVGGPRPRRAGVDEGYADVALARLYDVECPWHPQDDFYLALDLQGGSVLDVGSGTGTRLVRAREAGHRGHLVGLRMMLDSSAFRIEGWYGDWDRSPVTPTSPEIIVLARPTRG